MDIDKETFARLGRHLFFLTQDADQEVYDRWKEMGLTEEFADYIVDTKNKMKVLIDEHSKKENTWA